MRKRSWNLGVGYGNKRNMGRTWERDSHLLPLASSLMQKMSSEQMLRRKRMEIVDSYSFRTCVKDIFEKRK